MVQQSAHLMGVFLPGHEMQEAQNKLEAFRLFAYVDENLRFPAGRTTLPSLAARARALAPWQRSFALEGVAHYYTSTAGEEMPPGGLLADPELPETAMVPMHAGMGTAFANNVLSRLGTNPSDASLRTALHSFAELCRANSRPGWYDNAFEAMGLAVRTMHPHLLLQAGRAAGEIDAAAQDLFWHGVGRSLYFVPMNFVSVGYAHSRALRSAIDEAPTPEARRNTVAGLAWAVTLVNVRHPAVLQNFVRACSGKQVGEAVSNGVVSALMVWKHMAPGKGNVLAPYVQAASPETPGGNLWNDLVVAPAGYAFDEIFPALAGAAGPDQPTIASLFRYHDAPALPAETGQA